MHSPRLKVATMLPGVGREGRFREKQALSTSNPLAGTGKLSVAQAIAGKTQRRARFNSFYLFHSPPPTPPTQSRSFSALQDGSIPYGDHYQNYAGRRKKEVHFRVRLSWAKLELIVTDRPNARRFADFRPKQR